MTRHQITDKILQFSTYFEPVNFTFDQYLLDGPSPILVATGPVPLAGELLGKLSEELGDKALAYVFVSHFESDECGALALVLQRYPEAKVICSETTARQLRGFGITDRLVPQKAGSSLKVEAWELHFIAYPAEMHNWEGLIMYEKNSRTLFSSDLFIRFGKFGKEYLDSSIKEELAALASDAMLSSASADKLKKEITALEIKRIAVGHGPYIRV
jgi:flavorubredoxin